MTSESKLLIDLWDYFRDLISTKSRPDAVLHLIRLFEEHGFELELSELEGEDHYLDDAVESLREDEDSEEYDEDEY